MRYTLENFYQSREWEKCRKLVIAERITEDGYTMCEYCGKPIIRSYDIIGHHKVELTEDNVNDAEISINPDNIMLLHLTCHNKIHEKFGKKQRKVYIVYGSPLSGKTSYVNEIREPGDLIVDIDNIWQCVSGEARYKKDGRLKAVVFKIRDALLESVKYRQGKWLNAYIIGGYPYKGERERLQKELNAEVIYIESTQEECLQRLKEDERPKEWKQFVNDWWESFER